MPIGIKDIAAAAGVSEATVSLALNRSGLVSDRTRERILAIAGELGYVPNAAARSLARRKNRMLGLIVPDIENVFYSTLVKYINGHAHAMGYGLSIGISDNRAETERRIVDEMIQNRPAGVIAVPMNVPNRNPSYFAHLDRYQVPYLFCSDYYKALAGAAPRVLSDLESGMYALARHVAELGYRDIVYMTGSSSVPTLELRETGLRRALGERGLEPCVLRLGRLDYAEACRRTRQHMERKRKPDAFVCVNDMLAIGVVNTLTAMGVSVPGDIGVAGFDDVIFSHISPIEITTVRQDIGEMAARSVEGIIRMAGGERPEDRLIATSMVCRNSLRRR